MIPSTLCQMGCSGLLYGKLIMFRHSYLLHSLYKPLVPQLKKKVNFFGAAGCVFLQYPAYLDGNHFAEVF